MPGSERAQARPGSEPPQPTPSQCHLARGVMGVQAGEEWGLLRELLGVSRAVIGKAARNGRESERQLQVSGIPLGPGRLGLTTALPASHREGSQGSPLFF